MERYLSWSVDRVPLTLHASEPVKTHVANVRSDSRQVIGVVTAGFQTIQNQELIDLAYAVRNAGSIDIAKFVQLLRLLMAGIDFSSQ